MSYRVPAALLHETFALFRRCGGGRRECQVLWVSTWEDQFDICDVVHSRHHAHAGGFELETDWINGLWFELAQARRGIRVQVHTHPHEAFHSCVDDDYPIIHSIGFLSLVIPDYARGPVSFERAYLAEIAPDGTWFEVPTDSRLEVI